MTIKDKLVLIKKELNVLYPTTKVFLNSNNEFQFLIAVLLSSQAKDIVVNKVTVNLFNKYNDIKSLSKADLNDVYNIIKSVGLGQTKAKNIINLSKIIHQTYHDKIPHDLETLKTLPGVGHKVATVFLAEIDNEKYIPVDTHILRICYRLGISSKNLSAYKLQLKLEKYYPYEDYINFHRQMILFGRNICLSGKNKKCNDCPLYAICREV